MKRLSKSRYTLFCQCPKTLWPNEPSLNYYNLDACCQNGGNPMTFFLLIEHMTPEDAAAGREALLRYCELDIWAMSRSGRN